MLFYFVLGMLDFHTIRFLNVTECVFAIHSDQRDAMSCDIIINDDCGIIIYVLVYIMSVRVYYMT